MSAGGGGAPRSPGGGRRGRRARGRGFAAAGRSGEGGRGERSAECSNRIACLLPSSGSAGALYPFEAHREDLLALRFTVLPGPRARATPRKDGAPRPELALGTWGLSGDGYGPVDEATQQKVARARRRDGLLPLRHRRRLRRRAHGALARPRALGPARRRRGHQGRHRPHDRPPAQALRRPRTSAQPFKRSLAPPRARADRPLPAPQPQRWRPSSGGEALDTLPALKDEGRSAHWGVERRRREGRARGAALREPRSSSSPTTSCTRRSSPPGRGRHRRGRGRPRALDARLRPPRRQLAARTASSPTGDHRARSLDAAWSSSGACEQLRRCRFLVQRRRRARCARRPCASSSRTVSCPAPCSARAPSSSWRSSCARSAWARSTCRDEDLMRVPRRARERRGSTREGGRGASVGARRGARGGRGDPGRVRRAVRRRVQGEGRSGHPRRQRGERAPLRPARARLPGSPRRRGERPRPPTPASAAPEAAWFVDPLDGTREFVATNGEFAVMVGLAERGRATSASSWPRPGSRAFVGIVGEGAWEVDADGAAGRST